MYDLHKTALPPTFRTAVDVLINLPDVAVQMYVPESSYFTDEMMRRPWPSSTARPDGSSPFSFAQLITIGSLKGKSLQKWHKKSGSFYQSPPPKCYHS